MNPWLLLAAVIAVGAALGAGYYKGNQDGQAEVQQQWDKERAKQMAEFAENQRLAREKEQALQQSADRLRQEKDLEIKNVSARATALSNSLRDRQTRPTADASQVSNSTGIGQAYCTGKQLYREDSEFLVRVAREADELRAALTQCYNQYDEVRKQN